MDRLNAVVRVADRPNEFEVAADRAPSDAERAALQRRANEVEALLLPGDPTALAAPIAVLLGMFPASAGDDAKTRLAGYLMAVDGLPVWAVDRAARRFIRGEVDGVNRAFAPSSAQLAAEARAELAPALAERHKLHRVLSARVQPVIPQEERERVAARLAALGSAVHRAFARGIADA